MTVPLQLPPDSCKVATGPALAVGMISALGDDERAAWLDPSVGSGAFLEALAQFSVSPNRIRAIDIETTLGVNDHLAMTVRGQDFVTWARETHERFDRIIANPPYVAMSRLPSDLRSAATSFRSRVTGTQVSLGSNYWCAFLLASLDLLKPNGHLCFVLPAAWDYAEYAIWFRNELRRFFQKLEVHRSWAPMFPPVQEGSVVVVATGFGGKECVLRRHEHESAERLISSLALASPDTHSCSANISPEPCVGHTCRLGEVMLIKIGGVTGDAEYFLLNESRRSELDLPEQSLRPVLSKARHLCAAQVDRSVWEILRKRDERVWLFDPTLEFMSHRAVRRYLDLDEAHGGCHRDRYKVRIRSPWYRVPMPTRIHGFISGMSTLGPWVCLNGTSSLAASNTLYSVEFRSADGPAQRSAWGLSLLSTSARAALSRSGRIYPDGLVKHEPGDLSRIRIPVPSQIRGAELVYRRAVEALLTGQTVLASQIADEWLKDAKV